MATNSEQQGQPEQTDRRRLPPLLGHAPLPGLILGIDSRILVMPAAGRANGLGGSNATGRVGGLQTVLATSPISVDSWDLVNAPIGPDLAR